MEPPRRPAETRLSRRAEPAGGRGGFLWILTCQPPRTGGEMKCWELLSPCSISIIVIIIGFKDLLIVHVDS